MSWFDHQEELGSIKSEKEESGMKILDVRLPGGSDFITINKNVVRRKFEDEIGRPILIICDECAELLQKEGGRSEEAKEEQQLKNEIESNMKSIAQLGRSAGVHLLIATQRNDSSIIPGSLQNNCLDIDTKVILGDKDIF